MVPILDVNICKYRFPYGQINHMTWNNVSLFHFFSLSLSLSLSLPLTFTNGIQCLLPSFFFSYMSINLSLVLSTYHSSYVSIHPPIHLSVNLLIDTFLPQTQEPKMVLFFDLLNFLFVWSIIVPALYVSLPLYPPSLSSCLRTCCTLPYNACLPTSIYLPTYLQPSFCWNSLSFRLRPKSQLNHGLASLTLTNTHSTIKGKVEK